MNKKNLYPNFGILLVDDEPSYIRSISLLLERKGGINNLISCNDSRLAMDILAANNIGVVLLDVTMPHISGIELLQSIHKEYPEISVVIISGLNNVDSAVQCLKKGAFDYFVKTTEEDRLLEGIKRAILMQQITYENRSMQSRMLDDKLVHPEAFDAIVSRSKIMNSIFHYIESISLSNQPIMISGESGTGKTLLAKACHEASVNLGEFITVNAGILDDGLFSDTLFGHEEGAFAGASLRRMGLIEKAAGGTLFLDNIDGLSTQSQVKLLRLLQEGEYYPLGSDQPKRCRARIVVSTNEHIETQRDNGKFRKDLYYRLCSHMIKVPPLRARKEDIPLLLEHLLELAAKELEKATPSYPPQLPVLLSNYHFPGNVHELKALIYNAVSRHRSKVLSMETFKEVIDEHSELSLTHSPEMVAFNPELNLPTLTSLSDLLVEEAMQRSNNNQSLAARMLGISQPALSKRLKKLKQE